ncbi:MAG: hypothetical protein ACFFE8_17065, partial [Candidatus Heimdallarchaeota archaeon]
GHVRTPSRRHLLCRGQALSGRPFLVQKVSGWRGTHPTCSKMGIDLTIDQHAPQSVENPRHHGGLCRRSGVY